MLFGNHYSIILIGWLGWNLAEPLTYLLVSQSTFFHSWHNHCRHQRELRPLCVTLHPTTSLVFISCWLGYVHICHISGNSHGISLWPPLTAPPCLSFSLFFLSVWMKLHCTCVTLANTQTSQWPVRQTPADFTRALSWSWCTEHAGIHVH